jgi:hypothetical protein
MSILRATNARLTTGLHSLEVRRISSQGDTERPSVRRGGPLSTETGLCSHEVASPSFLNRHVNAGDGTVTASCD